MNRKEAVKENIGCCVEHMYTHTLKLVVLCVYSYLEICALLDNLEQVTYCLLCIFTFSPLW